MTKEEVQKRVTKNGRPLSLDKFEWDEKTSTFSSKEDYLIFNFQDVDGISFNVQNHCFFMTGNNCTFKTKNHCSFTTGHKCSFDIGYNCYFKIGDNSNFIYGRYAQNEKIKFKRESLTKNTLINDAIVCKRGSISIQASASHYSLPRENYDDMYKYNTWEISITNKLLSQQLKKKLKKHNMHDGVYSFVPKELVHEIVNHLNR